MKRATDEQGPFPIFLNYRYALLASGFVTIIIDIFRCIDNIIHFYVIYYSC